MKIVIVGGGFAGMNLAKALAGSQGIEVILVDKNNYHFFPPLIYQVATSFIEPSNIAYPFRKMFQKKDNIRFHYGSLVNINVVDNSIQTDSSVLTYDYLVLAMGTETNYFGMENVMQRALPMKTIDDALSMRNHLLLNLEKATLATDALEQERHRSIVIAGGGPTGVELAGMLAEMGKVVLERDYPEFREIHAQIYLIDASATLLSSMSKKSQQEALQQLTKLGVTIKLKTAVKDYTDHKVLLSTGEEINTYTLIWSSGVIARSAPGLPAQSIGKGRRILVDAYNKVEGTPNVFAIGDICLQTTDKNYVNGHPQLAQVAIQQAKYMARNFKNVSEQKSMIPFRYVNKGSMAIISKFKAVVDLPKGFYKGFFAWFTWLFIHIIPIAGFRNKAKLLYNWFWSFITNDPTLRLIIRPSKK